MSELILKTALFWFHGEIESKGREREKKKEKEVGRQLFKQQKIFFCDLSKRDDEFHNKASNL